MAQEIVVRLKKVSRTKALIGGAYAAEDVLSESATNAVGTAWIFTGCASSNGRGGYIVRAQALSETTNLTPRLTLYLFTSTPTCELDDNAASNCVLHADVANYIGKVDFNPMEDLGGDSSSIATPSTFGNVPLPFVCATTDTNLYGVLVTRDAFTQTAGDDIVIMLIIEQE